MKKYLKEYHYETEDFRWYRNTTGKKVWEEKNKIDGSWEFVSFLANYYNIMKNNGHRYCTSCGNKSVRLNYAELSNRDRELGVYLDDADKRYEYDKSRMIEKKMFDDKFIKINTDERYDLSLGYLWECVTGCIITDTKTGFYDNKKLMIEQRIKEGLPVDDIIKKTSYQKRMEEKAEQNMKVWDKFM